jgi:hypothetical protein
MDDRHREKWYDLPEVYVKLERDKLGYPPKDWEQLKAEPTDREDQYRLKSIPFYARGLAYEDEVRVNTSLEGYYPAIETVVKRSGYSTMRLWLKDEDNREALIDRLTEHGCLLEFNGRMAAVAVPRGVFDVISDYICDEKDRGRWDAEDGYLVIDEAGKGEAR